MTKRKKILIATLMVVGVLVLCCVLLFAIPALRHGVLAMDAGDPVANVKLLRFAGAAGYSWTRQP